MITGIHHTGIVVNDLDRMVRFYRDDLGLSVLNELDSQAPPDGDHTGVPGAKRKLVFLGTGDGHQIELVHYIDPPASEGSLDKHQLGAMHLCFNVEDIERVFTTLSEQGIRFVSRPKYASPGGKGRIGIVYAQDPEGNWLEFIQWQVANSS